MSNNDVRKKERTDGLFKAEIKVGGWWLKVVGR